MGSPITLSGFNQIDFNVILNAVMQQERLPVTQLETQKKVLDAQKSAFSTLASKLASLESAVEDLQAADAFDGTTATVSDPTRLSVSADATAPAGTYEIVVNQVARSQVTTSSVVADADAVIATGGTLTIGGTQVTLSGDTSLRELASAINSTADVGVNASVVKTPTGYSLMLTGRDTGVANAFTVTNALTGGPSALTFSNSQPASDATITLNSVQVTSASNTFSDTIAGASFTVHKQDAGNPIIITITASNDSIKSLVEKVALAFNEVKKFLGDQQSAALRGEANNIGRDSLVRGLRSSLTQTLTASYATGGAFKSLAEIGFTIARNGDLEFDSGRFEEALRSGKADVRTLFRGADGTGGVFGAMKTAVTRYTEAGGLVLNAQDRLTAQSTKISSRIADLEARLAVRREALQREFIAADLAIAQLNAQRTQLSQLGSSYSL
jgi:flagellar hook-associated protein 2